MKVLHIPTRNIGLKKTVNGMKTVLLEQVKWENCIENIESKILIYDKIEENNPFFINKNSIKEDILNYKPDLVIFDGFWTIQHYFIAKFLKKNKIKYYIKPHGAFNKIAQSHSKIKYLKKIIARLLFFNNYIKNSDGLIFLNENERKNSIYRKKKEFFFPNGIEYFDNKNKYKKQIKNINFIFLGRIDIYTKGLDLLLEMLLQHKYYFIENNIFFKFYGKGMKKDMEQFYNYLYKMDEIIRYYGVVYGDRKYEILEENDIFILLSRFEGMPMGILESLSRGLPCFVSNEIGIGEYIEKYNAGWVTKNNDELFLNLKKCIEDFKDKTKIYYRNNSLKCIKNFYWKNLIKNYESEYEKMNKGLIE